MIKPTSLGGRIAIALLGVSAAGVLYTADKEDVRTQAYLDPLGIPTICAGSTRGVLLNMEMSRDACMTLLKEELGYAGRAIRRCTPVAMTQSQYDALADHVHNIGPTAYCTSTLSRKLKAEDCHGAAAEFPRWVWGRDRRTGKKVKLPGLIKRKGENKAQFEAGCEVWTS